MQSLDNVTTNDNTNVKSDIFTNNTFYNDDKREIKEKMNDSIQGIGSVNYRTSSLMKRMKMTDDLEKKVSLAFNQNNESDIIVDSILKSMNYVCAVTKGMHAFVNHEQVDVYISDPINEVSSNRKRSPTPSFDDEKTLLHQYLIDDLKISVPKSSDVLYSNRGTDRKYKSWKEIGVSYRADPSRHPLSQSISITDFDCNDTIRAIVVGSEGISHDGDNAKILYTVFSEAQLILSMTIDEIGIGILKLEKSLFQLADSIHKGLSPRTNTFDLAHKRYKLSHQLLALHDDEKPKYCPFMRFSISEAPNMFIPHVSFSDLLLCTNILLNLEQQPNMFVIKGCPITSYASQFLNCFDTCYKSNKKEMRFISPSSIIGFLYNLFSFCGRLIVYLEKTRYIPFKSLYEAFIGSSLRDKPIFGTEIHEIAKNIHNGGCLSQLYCELRNSAIAIIASKSYPYLTLLNRSFSEKYTGLLYEKVAFHISNGRPLYEMTFQTNDSISGSIKKLQKEFASKFLDVSPIYQPCILRDKIDHDEDIDHYLNQPHYQKNGIEFTMKQSEKQRVFFKPGGSDFYFSLLDEN